MHKQKEKNESAMPYLPRTCLRNLLGYIVLGTGLLSGLQAQTPAPFQRGSRRRTPLRAFAPPPRDTLSFSLACTHCIRSLTSGTDVLPATAEAPTLPASFDADTLGVSFPTRTARFRTRLDGILTSQAFQMTYVGVPLIVSGLIIKSEDDHFHDLRNAYVPTFRNHYDDYLQYTPALAMLGLKIAGVESRNSWGRMLVSDAFSVALMGLTINALKYTTHVERPDKSNRHSFPSGHTATAFMTATMLHKEYGLTVSPWYSIGAYSVATATALSRMLNNKHWLSDVTVGAGIGILSTEVGYYLADLLFKEKGIRRPYLDYQDFDFKRNPSYFGLYMGFVLTPTRFSLSPTIRMKASPGSIAGFEGAWFKNRYLGIGGRLTASSQPLSLTVPLTESLPAELAARVKGFRSEPLDRLALYVGPYFSFPLSDRCLLGTKLLVGGRVVSSNRIYALYTDNPAPGDGHGAVKSLATEQAAPQGGAFPGGLAAVWPDKNKLRAGNGGLREGEFQEPEIKEKELIHVKTNFGIGYATGLSVVYLVKQNLGVKVFTDYTCSPSRFVTFQTGREGETTRFERHKTIQSFALGASLNVMLW